MLQNLEEEDQHPLSHRLMRAHYLWDMEPDARNTEKQNKVPSHKLQCGMGERCGSSSNAMGKWPIKIVW